MNCTPEKTLRRIGFYTLVGVEDVHRDGEGIVGRWSQSLRRFYSPQARTLAEDFANWSCDEDGALRFTKLYGPLDDSPQPGATFQFKLRDWGFFQQSFRKSWEHLRPQRGVQKGLVDFQGQRVESSWEYSDGQLAYRTPNLRRFLFLDLFSIPAERLRKCANPNCETPCFVARHLKQLYCSPACAEEGQRAWKRRWWKEHGQEWRKGKRDSRRKTKRKGKRQ